jgi:hypothetical protein
MIGLILVVFVLFVLFVEVFLYLLIEVVFGIDNMCIRWLIIDFRVFFIYIVVSI